MNRRILAGLVLAMGLPFILQAQPEPQRLTKNHEGDSFPVWNPETETIAFKRERIRDGVKVWEIGAVESDGTDERVLASVDVENRSLASSLTWINRDELITYENDGYFPEVLKFDVTKAPVTRTDPDGPDATFTVLLEGFETWVGWVRVSRNGSYALWRNHDSGDTQWLTYGSIFDMFGQFAHLGGEEVLREGKDESFVHFHARLRADTQWPGICGGGAIGQRGGFVPLREGRNPDQTAHQYGRGTVS